MEKKFLRQFADNRPGLPAKMEVDYFALKYFGALWCVPVGMTLLGISDARIALVVIFISLLCFGMMVKYPSTVLIGLPFFALLAPVGGFFQLAGVKAVVTDWLMIGLGLFIALFYRGTMVGKNVFDSSPSLRTIIQTLMGMYLISFILGFIMGSVISFAPLYYLYSFFVVFYFFDRYSVAHNNSQLILDAWCIAALFGSALMLKAYSEGRPLVNFASEDYDLIVDRFQLDYIFQATYYYAGFHFVVGILAAGLLVRLVFSDESLTLKFGQVLVLFVFFAVLTVAINKTSLLAVFWSVFSVYLIVAFRLNRLSLRAISVFVLILGYFFYSFGWQLLREVSGGTDEYFYAATNVSSLMIRFEVWQNALSELISQPWFIPFGLGPNAIEAGNQEIASEFKVSYVSRQIEGALDSTWLTYLVEFGVIGFIIILWFFYWCLVVMKNALFSLPREKVSSPTFTMALCGIIYLLVSSISQSLGYAKISWFAFTILLTACSFHSANFSRK